MNQPPLVASWAMTSACNLCCTHCGLSCSTAGETGMSFSEGFSLLQKLKDFGVREIILSGGECTLHPDFYLLACTALEMFDHIKIITNGRMGKHIFTFFERLSSAQKLMIVTSLDGIKETHDARRGQGSFDLVLETLQAETSIARGVITTFDTKNFQERNELFSLILLQNIHFWSLQMCLPAGRMEYGKDQILSFEDLEKLADFAVLTNELLPHTMVQIDDCFGYSHPIREKIGEWQGCHAGKRLISIFPNGDISGCPTMPHRICGNIRSQSFLEIWESEEMHNIRKKTETCDTCDQCPGGCPAVEHTIGKQFCFVQHSKIK